MSGPADWLTAPDGQQQWRQHVHSRCNGRDIRCPWCPPTPDLRLLTRRRSAALRTPRHDTGKEAPDAPQA